MSKSLALLVCDTPQGQVYATHGDYQAIFSKFFQASLDSLASQVQFNLDPYDVVHKMEYPPEDKLESYCGIVITGSAAAAYENLEWINTLIAYVKRIGEEKPHIKIIGICYGHQIVARAFGGECVPNGGKWEVGPTPLELTDVGKKVFGVETLNIQEMHRDHVPAVPSTFHLLGSTSVSYNQGMVRLSEPNATSASDFGDIHIFTVQGHPEYNESIVSGIVERRSASGVIDAATVADLERRKSWQNDGVGVVGRAIWKVLGVGA